MTSKYHDWSPDQIEKEIKTYKKAIREYTPLLTSSDGPLKSYAQEKIDKWTEVVKDLEECLKPKIDYEDGSWV